MVWAKRYSTIAVTTKPVHKYNQSGEYRVPKSVTVEDSPPSVPCPLFYHPPRPPRIWLHPLVPRPLPSSPHSLSYRLPLPLGPVLVGQVLWAGDTPTPVCVCVCVRVCVCVCVCVGVGVGGRVHCYTVGACVLDQYTNYFTKTP